MNVYYPSPNPARKGRGASELKPARGGERRRSNPQGAGSVGGQARKGRGASEVIARQGGGI